MYRKDKLMDVLLWVVSIAALIVSVAALALTIRNSRAH